MAVLVDSNVLIFSVQQGHPWHEESIRALEFFLAAEEPVCIFLQHRGVLECLHAPRG